MDRGDVTRSLRKGVGMCVGQGVWGSSWLAVFWPLVRVIQQLLQKLHEPCELPLEEQRQGFDRLGDLCTGIGVHRVALKHYKKAVSPS